MTVDTHVAKVAQKGGRVKIYFKADDVPPISVAILFGVQQLMVCVSGLVVIPYILSEKICAGSHKASIRVQLISTTLLVSGISTLLQNTFGVRLALLQGPSFAFLPPLLAFTSLPEFQCHSDISEMTSEEDGYLIRLRKIQGGLLAASAVQIVIGFTGLIGIITKFIGPLTIAPLMLLLALSAVPVCLKHVATHWVSLLLAAALVACAIYLAKVKVPLPLLRNGRLRLTRVPIFTLFPYLIAIGSCWLFCLILTLTNTVPPDSAARTDKNETMLVLRDAPWLRLPYPGQWGPLDFHTGIFLGFVAATLSSVIESVGDYHACARVSDERVPPPHAVNRGILIEGICCLIAALFGSGVGVTTYSENIGVIGITKVASRVTLQICGIILVGLGVFTKFGAILATIPEPLVGGILSVSLAMVGGVGLSSVQFVNLNLSRNVAILGLAIMSGMAVPLYFEQYPLNTGMAELDQVLNILLTIRMFVGGFVGFLLDNTVPGASREQRGLQPHNTNEKSRFDDGADHDCYSFPPLVNRILARIPLVRLLLFLPELKKKVAGTTGPHKLIIPIDTANL